MNFSEFELAHPQWLLALSIPIFLLLLIPLSRRQNPFYRRIRDFADAHLLPHLIVNSTSQFRFPYWTRHGILWSILWILGVLALAGPRWDYEEQEVVKPNINLMILLDFSDSMRVKDLPHSRLEQALQEIEELLDKEADIYIGLMVFAGTSHLVTPLTDDYNTLRHLLYELAIDLVPIQGSELTPALKNAARWLKGPNTHSIGHILLISDGEFEQSDRQTALTFLQQNDFYLHTLGVGTEQGDYILREDGTWQKDAQGEVVISRLNETTLRQLAIAGKGTYHHADYRREDTQAILTQIEKSARELSADKTLQKLWHERFYLLVGLMVLLILPWFRKPRFQVKSP